MQNEKHKHQNKLTNYIYGINFINDYTSYTSVYPAKSSVHGLLNSWTCSSGLHNIVKGHDNISSNLILQK